MIALQLSAARSSKILICRSGMNLNNRPFQQTPDEIFEMIREIYRVGKETLNFQHRSSTSEIRINGCNKDSSAYIAVKVRRDTPDNWTPKNILKYASKVLSGPRDIECMGLAIPVSTTLISELRVLFVKHMTNQKLSIPERFIPYRPMNLSFWDVSDERVINFYKDGTSVSGCIPENVELFGEIHRRFLLDRHISYHGLYIIGIEDHLFDTDEDVMDPHIIFMHPEMFKDWEFEFED